MLLKLLLVCFFAGLGAGLGTGFAGMSAAAVIRAPVRTVIISFFILNSCEGNPAGVCARAPAGKPKRYFSEANCLPSTKAWMRPRERPCIE